VTGQEVEQRSDLFSLGMVAYFLLTGRLPFEGQNALAVMYARIKEAVTPPSSHGAEVPQDLEHVVLRCLAVEKESRFPDAKALQKVLAACRCASEWDEERANDWWEEMAAAATLVGGRAGQATSIFTPITPLDA
jgi:serine/threonine-protein kinase